MRPLHRAALPFTATLALVFSTPCLSGAATPTAPLADPREAHLADLVQLTHGGQNAEAYWSPDGRQLIFQSTRPPYACDQIFRMPADGTGSAALVSTGTGRTTCSYFTPDGSLRPACRILNSRNCKSLAA
jgi:WD40 repeat protein